MLVIKILMVQILVIIMAMIFILRGGSMILIMVIVMPFLRLGISALHNMLL